MHREQIEMFAATVDSTLRSLSLDAKSFLYQVRNRNRVYVLAARRGIEYADKLGLDYHTYARRAVDALMVVNESPRSEIDGRSVCTISVYEALCNNADAALYTDNEDNIIEWSRVNRMRTDSVVLRWLHGCIAFQQIAATNELRKEKLTYSELMWFSRTQLPSVFMWDYVPFRGFVARSGYLQSPVLNFTLSTAISECRELTSRHLLDSMRSLPLVRKWHQRTDGRSTYTRRLFEHTETTRNERPVA